MSLMGQRFRAMALALAVILTGIGGGAPTAWAQEGGSATALSFQDLNMNELITSTVFLQACDNLRPSTGSVTLASFERATGACWFGSGTVIDPSGLILTNAHVALDNKQDEPVWVLVNRTVDARSDPVPAFFARAVLYSPAWGERRSFGSSLLDLAVLAPVATLDGAPIQPGQISMRPLPMATAEGTISIGDDLRNIGYPDIGGRLITITEGTVSGFEPDANVHELGNGGWIKTDATLGGGISGGTTINKDGFQIGVPTELGDTEMRPVCHNDTGQNVECNVGQINHIRPIPEGFNLLKQIGQGDGLPGAPPDTGTPDSGQPATTTSDAVTVTGSIVSADTGQPVAGAWFIVLEPGVAVADYLNGAQDTVYTFATSGADGRFQLKKPVARGQSYGVAVIARGYNNMQEDGRVLAPADAPPVVTLPPIEMALQR